MLLQSIILKSLNKFFNACPMTFFQLFETQEIELRLCLTVNTKTHDTEGLKPKKLLDFKIFYFPQKKQGNVSIQYSNSFQYSNQLLVTSLFMKGSATSDTYT